MTPDEIIITPVVIEVPLPSLGWDELGLTERSLELIKKSGYTTPTPVQIECLPYALKGQDIIASAQTGTGKTAAFVLPMVESFYGREGTFGLILAPTREIAQQIQATLEIFATPQGIRSCVLIGGVNMRHDDLALKNYPQIIVATPGRLCDHLDRGNIWLDYLEVVVLDEADRMLDMGFTAQISRIMEDVPKKRQTMLFSATISPSVQKLAQKILHQPKVISIGRPSSAAITVEQRLLWVNEDSKNRELMRLLHNEKGSIIVFTRSKDSATRVWRSLHSAGFYDATYIHSDRMQSHREQALAEFKEGKYRILIATDVAARGLHIEGVAHVVNYDLPFEAENYVHRIGRTGRAGATGKATSFVTPRDKRLLADIEKVVGRQIPAGNSPPPDRPPSESAGRGARPQGRPSSRSHEPKKANGSAPSAGRRRGPRRPPSPQGKT